MAFDSATYYKAAFKKLYQIAHTTNDREPPNEPLSTQVLLGPEQIIGEELSGTPAVDANTGKVEVIEAELEALSGTDYGWQAVFPAGYSGHFGAGVIGDPVSDHTFAVPKSYNTSLIDDTGSHAGGYAEKLEDDGVYVPASGGASGQDWIWDPYSGIVTFESSDSPTIDLGSTGTIWIYIYIGNKISDNLKKNNFVGATGPTAADDNESGYSVGSFWIDTVLDEAFICVDDATGVAVWSQIDGGGEGASAHDELTGLDADDHTQYALLDGRSGGQVLYGGTGSGDDLILNSTSHATVGTITIASNVGTNVGIGMTDPNRQLVVLDQDDPNSISGTDVDVSEVMTAFRLDADANGYGVGIGFQISSNAANIGAAIVHQRTGGWSEGGLHFATKSSGLGSGANIPIRMTIDSDGAVGIGVMSPSGDLDVFDGTGVIYYKPSDPSDWTGSGPTGVFAALDELAAREAGGLENIVEDTSPELGADLNVNGYDIISSTGVDINITSGGTGVVNIGNDAGGGIVLGSDSLKEMYPHTTLMMDAGKEDKQFREMHAQSFIGGHRVAYSENNVTDPPTAAELTTAFGGSPSTVGQGFISIIDDDGGDAPRIVISNGTDWFYTADTIFTKAS